MSADRGFDPLATARELLTGSPDAYVVGGRVRDVLLGRPTLDTDLVLPGDALGAARRIARQSGGVFVELDPVRAIARVVWPGTGKRGALDIAALAGPTLEEDLRRRDFTVNAMAAPLAGPWPPDPARVVDPTGGRSDLALRRLRVTHPQALDDDPLRLLRAVRLSAELGFAIEPASRAAIRARAQTIALPAAERARDELLRLLATPVCASAVADLDALGLLAVLLPEVTAGRGVTQSPPHHEDVLDHTLAVLSRLVSLHLRLAAALTAPGDFGAGSTGAVAGAPVVVEGDLGTGSTGAVAGAPVVVEGDLGAGSTGADAGAPGATEADFGAGGPFEGLLQRWSHDLNRHLAAEHRAGQPRAVYHRLAALLHDIGKPRTVALADDGRIRFRDHENVGAELASRVTHRLRLGAAESDYVASVVRHHLRPLHLAHGEGLSRRAVYRYFAACGDAGVDVAVLALADNGGRAARDTERGEALAAVVDRLLLGWFERRTVEVTPAPLLSGHAVMADLALPPGPEVGRLLAALREAQASGAVGDEATARAFVRAAHTDRA